MPTLVLRPTVGVLTPNAALRHEQPHTKGALPDNLP